MRRARTWLAVAAIFTVGWTAGMLMAAGRGVTPQDWTGKSREEAARSMLSAAKDLAGDGSWERIAVARVHYRAGRRTQAETIFSDYTGARADETDLLRIARVYMEAGEWDAARPILERYDIRYVVVGEPNVFDVVDYLFEACSDAESTVIGHAPKEVIEIGPLVLFPGDEVSANHSQFIQVRHKR